MYEVDHILLELVSQEVLYRQAIALFSAINNVVR